MSKSILIETKGISKSYGKRKVIDDLNLQIEEGDIYGFLGPNGSGKTTTIRLILGLINPDEGQILLNGYDISTQFKKAISEVGAIVENPSFFTYLSGYKNLLLIANLYPGINKNRVEEVLEIVKLKDNAKDKVKTYSLGMKQRLGIAAALLNNPRIIILDEPTNGMDPQGMKEIKELIISLAEKKGITFFISSHLLHEVEQMCTKIGVLKNGRLIAEEGVKGLLLAKNEFIEVTTPDKEKAEAVLKGIDFVHSINGCENGLLVQIECGNSSKLNQLLTSSGIEVVLLSNKQVNNLETFYFDITEGGE